MHAKPVLCLAVAVVMAVVGVWAVGPRPETAMAQGPESPEAVAEAFYTWYLDYTRPDPQTGEFDNPLVDGAYRESPYLSQALIERVEAMADEEMGFMADPFLCAQDTPERVAVELIEAGEETASVLVQTYFGFNPLPHNLTAHLVRTEGAWQIDAITCGERVTPEGVVEGFYQDYIAYARPVAQPETFRNPLVDGFYREDDRLSADLIAQVDEQVAAGQLMADPLLCAQDVPMGVSADAAMVAEETATVIVHQFFSGNPEPRDILVSLGRGAEGWQIESITCQVPPEAIAAHFYRLYSIFARHDLETGGERQPLTDWGYRWVTEYLSEGLLRQLSEGFASGEPRQADPVLCAQNIPARIEATVVESAADRAVVLVSGQYPSGPDSYESYPLATVELAQTEGRWAITAITCAR